jgi:hypothetical protein
MMGYRIFFSHGGDDTYIAQSFLKPKLLGSGAHVFIDAGKIEYGDNFHSRILNELATCDELLAFFTHSSLKRPWIFAEVGATLIRHKRVVALVYGPTSDDLHELGILSLLGTNHILKLDDFDQYLDQLAVRVRGDSNV